MRPLQPSTSPAAPGLSVTVGSGAQAWLLAGGAHHTSFSQAVTAEHLEDLAAMLGVEYVRIGHGTDLTALKRELRWNDVAFRLARAHYGH